MPHPLSITERRRIREAARTVLRRRSARAAHVRVLRDHFEQDQTVTTDAVWEQRRLAEGWANVERLNLYLARRRVLEAGGDIFSVRTAMPFLGDEATPEKVMRELLKLDGALRTGDFEDFEFCGDTTVSLGTPALPHNDTSVGPYDGPGGLVMAGKEDGTNVPAHHSKPLGTA